MYAFVHVFFFNLIATSISTLLLPVTYSNCIQTKEKEKTVEHDIILKEEKKLGFHLTMNGVMKRKKKRIVRTIRHLLSLLYLVMSLV
jgi:hypothetical protein